jgi:alpha-L-arabinofuranosidase
MSGDWKLLEGALRQAGQGSNRRAVTGDSLWTDYTYTLKARKIGGAEGFLILFSVKDQENWVWWNIGGWGNTRHAIEYAEGGGKAVIGKEVLGSVESGRWYDIRIELKGENVKCYLDGKLIHDFVYDLTPPRALHAVASRVSATGEIILKVVNVSKHAVDTRIDLRGANRLGRKGEVSILTSDDPKSENSISEPEKIVPKTVSLEGIPADGRFAFPATSVTIIRLPTAQ